MYKNKNILNTSNSKGENNMKTLKFFITTLFMVIAMAITSFASTEIKSVSIRINEKKTDPGIVYEAELTSGSSWYEITDWSVSKDYSDWNPGKKVTFNVTIEPTEGYRFDRDMKNIYVSNGEVASKSIRSNKIELRVNYIPTVTLEDPTNIYFEDEYLAVWDEVEYCRQYEVQILKENDNGNYTSYKTVKVSEPEIDLAPYATDYYDITFKVRATYKDSDESRYIKASQWVNADDTVSSDFNTSYGNFSGSGENMRFRLDDGSYATGWQQLNGDWYYFNANNNNKAVVSSWLYVDNHWFYMNEYGIMQTGWIQINGYWYYLNPVSDGTRGAAITGWFCSGPNGPWYYFQQGAGGPVPECAMYSNMTTPDGYYVNADGSWWN